MVYSNSPITVPSKVSNPNKGGAAYVDPSLALGSGIGGFLGYRGTEPLKALQGDLYLGYDSIMDAVNDCKATSQVEAFARMIEGENIFISGPPGSGKSTVVEPFISVIQDVFPDLVVHKTAFTGLAATNINGQTLHSYARFASHSFYSYSEEMKDTDILVIDEISMLPPYLFQLLDSKLRVAKNRRNEPFGGIQLILMGDFLQLPPIKNREIEDPHTFCIETEAWEKADITLCYMDKVHRAQDPDLKKILVHMANDKITPEILDLLRARVNAPKKPGKNYIEIFTTNKKIDEHNTRELAKLPGTLKVFPPKFKMSELLTTIEKDYFQKQETLLKKNVIPLEVKVGAPVFITSNMLVRSIPKNKLSQRFQPGFSFDLTSQQVFNGQMGHVIDIGKYDVVVKVNGILDPVIIRPRMTPINRESKTKNMSGQTVRVSKVVGLMDSFPLKIGYATSIHKSQGRTYDAQVLDLTRTFSPGMGYVGISRVTSLDNLILKGFSESSLKMSREGLEASKRVKKEALENRRKFVENIDTWDFLLKMASTKHDFFTMSYNKKVSARSWDETLNDEHPPF